MHRQPHRSTSRSRTCSQHLQSRSTANRSASQRFVRSPTDGPTSIEIDPPPPRICPFCRAPLAISFACTVCGAPDNEETSQ